MNYFSHYFIDRQQSSAYYQLGLIMPDIYRGFNADLKKPMLHNGIVWNNEHANVVDGVKKHYLIDQRFHNLQQFNNWTQQLETLLSKYELKVILPRHYFLVHIWVEWLIDRILVGTFPEVVIDFYKRMSAIEKEVLDSFFKQMNKVEAGELFFSNFKRVVEQQYLFRLLDNEKFIMALINLYQHTLGLNNKNLPLPLLMAVNLEMQSILQPDIESLFIELSSY